MSSTPDDLDRLGSPTQLGGGRDRRDQDFSGLDFASDEVLGTNFEHSLFNGTNFMSCRFSGCNFRHTEFTEAQIQDCTFADCQLDYSDFVSTHLESCVFTRCSFSNAEWREAEFRSCEFLDCDLEEATVSLCYFAADSNLNNYSEAAFLDSSKTYNVIFPLAFPKDDRTQRFLRRNFGARFVSKRPGTTQISTSQHSRSPSLANLSLLYAHHELSQSLACNMVLELFRQEAENPGGSAYRSKYLTLIVKSLVGGRMFSILATQKLSDSLLEVAKTARTQACLLELLSLVLFLRSDTLRNIRKVEGELKQLKVHTAQTLIIVNIPGSPDERYPHALVRALQILANTRKRVVLREVRKGSLEIEVLLAAPALVFSALKGLRYVIREVRLILEDLGGAKKAWESLRGSSVSGTANVSHAVRVPSDPAPTRETSLTVVQPQELLTESPPHRDIVLLQQVSVAVSEILLAVDGPAEVEVLPFRHKTD